MSQNNKLSPMFKVVIIVLAVLLTCSVGALAVRFVYLHLKEDNATVTVSGNHIGQPESTVPVIASDVSVVSSENAAGSVEDESSLAVQPTAPLLEFYQGKADANKKFEVRNMLPGDVITRYFCIRAYHSQPVTLIFNTEVTEQTKQLGDVLDVVVSNPETGEVICQGTFNEINGKEFATPLAVNANEQTTLFYKIDVSMETSVDNPYQAARLLADLNWYIEESSSSLDPSPQTGDSVNIVLWVAVAGSAMLILFLLLFARRRKEEDQYE